MTDFSAFLLDQPALRWTIQVPRWQPATLNNLLRGWRQAAQLKRQDRDLIAIYGRDVPRATGKRRVSLTITLGPRQRAADPDASWKSCLDGLVHAGLLVDDNRQHVELGPVTFTRGPERGTTIVLEEV